MWLPSIYENTKITHQNCNNKIKMIKNCKLTFLPKKNNNLFNFLNDFVRHLIIENEEACTELSYLIIILNYEFFN